MPKGLQIRICMLEIYLDLACTMLFTLGIGVSSESVTNAVNLSTISSRRLSSFPIDSLAAYSESGAAEIRSHLHTIYRKAMAMADKYT